MTGIYKTLKETGSFIESAFCCEHCNKTGTLNHVRGTHPEYCPYCGLSKFGSPGSQEQNDANNTRDN